MNNENTQKELISILNKLKINDDELDELLMKKSEDKTIFTDKIMKVFNAVKLRFLLIFIDYFTYSNLFLL